MGGRADGDDTGDAGDMRPRLLFTEAEDDGDVDMSDGEDDADAAEDDGDDPKPAASVVVPLPEGGFRRSNSDTRNSIDRLVGCGQAMRVFAQISMPESILDIFYNHVF